MVTKRPHSILTRVEPYSRTKCPGNRCKTALYLFAGKKRRSDIGSRLRKLKWEVTEFDILRDKSHDLTNLATQRRLLQDVEDGRFSFILASPPCDTFSRVKFANQLGPAPIRDAEHPRGFDNLSGYQQRQADLGSNLVDFTFEAATKQLMADGMFVLEHPEDLGRVKSGYMKNAVPASIWRWPPVAQLLDNPKCWTAGLRQSDFGRPYVKPTRLLFINVDCKDPRLHAGLPVFAENGDYVGPIPHQAGAMPLAKQPGETGFRTTGTAAWPGQLCKMLAKACDIKFQADNAAMGHLDTVSLTQQETKATLPHSKAMETKDTGCQEGHWIGGTGPPRFTVQALLHRADGRRIRDAFHLHKFWT